MSKPICEITEEINKFLSDRTKVGLEKYGTTMDRNDLDLSQWLTHHIEELADALQYAWKARKVLNEAEKPLSTSTTESKDEYPKDHSELLQDS